ncbi:E3 ubiquitin-protein ligase TRIM21 isoform X2 [Takifugu flavidus]|uniref:E3 ubiquitin-protein ligase TRIM21 isoform X2 n=1 Tax=Takifugu flavidus TaxID=433684 RepID=UPI002544A674|nr:E3 ubiquitin-protein ligase TRIM21 isoform X2 [Takifugu flavidus]
MSLQGRLLSDEQFQCSICLDLFTNPSSTPCGHSFCLGCISEYWSSAKVCRCPLCKKTFQKRPNLQINRTLREITEQFKAMRRGGGPVTGKRGDGGNPCAFVEEMKQSKSMKKLTAPASKDSVIPTLASSLPNHSPLSALNHASKPPPPPPPTLGSRGRRRFTLTTAAGSLPLCQVHHRGLLIYCKNDRVCICPDCETEDHYDHDTVTIKQEWLEKKLRLSEQMIQEMIRQRIRKMEEIRESVSNVKVELETEMAGSICLFSALMSAIERTQVELIELMEMSQKAVEEQAEAALKKLEQENKELQKRVSALEELAQSDDFTHCIKTFPSLILPPPVQDWSAVSIGTYLGTKNIYRKLAVQVERFNQELKNVAEKGFPMTSMELSPVQPQPRMKRLQEYAVDVTLDVNTAHPRLIISDDMKSVWCGDQHQLLPDNQERFDRIICVLGREMMSSGRHYWEVDVTGKTDWDLGVARKSVSRKGKITVTPGNGYWFLSLRDKERYAFHTVHSSDVHLNLQPHKIGIFVDFENGQVSFYNVNAQLHIYTFNDSFSDSIYPFFSPCSNKYGKNDEPLTITPVNMIE